MLEHKGKEGRKESGSEEKEEKGEGSGIRVYGEGIEKELANAR